MIRYFVTCACVLAATSLALGANLLQDPTFSEGPNGTITCADWDKPFSEFWHQPAGSTDARRNPSTHLPECPRDPSGANDPMHGGISTGNPNPYKMWQTVTAVTPGVTYALSGYWAGGNDTGGLMTYAAQLRDGDENGTVIASTGGTQPTGSAFAWTAFSTSGQAGSTQLTVVITISSGTAWGAKTIHVDDLQLTEEVICTNPPQVTGATPKYGARGGVATGIQINGAHFVPGQTTVKLVKTGETDIAGTSVSVDGSGTFLTCSFDLTSAAVGFWDVVVTVPDCPPAILTSEFNVVLPALTNGSFELPTAPGGCPVTPLGAPTDWRSIQYGGYGSPTASRDENAVYPPSCPPPDGDHYVSTKTDSGDGTFEMSQTVIADMGTTYTFSGFFAGGGANTVTISLLDGDIFGSVVDQKVIYAGTVPYDWTFATLSATPSSGLLTVLWQVSSNGADGQMKSAHADGFSLEPCMSALLAFGISPPDGDNATGAHGPIVSATVTGLGFSGGETPTVLLTRPGRAPIVATNVNVIDDSTLTCDLDLTARQTGRWTLLILKDGCLADIVDAFTITAPAFVNGGFELPDPGTPVQCGPPPTIVPGVPDGWSASLTPPGSMDRDHNVWYPPCPNPSDGGHYGSMTIGGSSGTLLAYQTIRVDPSKTYTFGGDFAGGGYNGVYVQLIEGAEDGPVFAESTVHDGLVDEGSYGWVSALVTDSPTGNIMTVGWRLEVFGDGTIAPGFHSTHADGLYVVDTPPCATPPTVASINPSTGAVDSTVNDATVTGTNLVAGSTSVKLRKAGQPDITATDVVVAGNGLSLTCDFDLTGADLGAWSVVVTVTGCPPSATLADGFTVTPVTPCNNPAQDTDGDGDVDLSDFSVFLACFNGPNRPWPGPPVPQQDCQCLDQDSDTDVDLADFGKFLSCFNGPARPPAAGCFLN